MVQNCDAAGNPCFGAQFLARFQLTYTPVLLSVVDVSALLVLHLSTVSKNHHKTAEVDILFCVQLLLCVADSSAFQFSNRCLLNVLLALTV
jgi:hypothetical protein